MGVPTCDAESRGGGPMLTGGAFAPGSGSRSAIAVAAQPCLEVAGECAVDELDDAADATDALDARAKAVLDGRNQNNT